MRKLIIALSTFIAIIPLSTVQARSSKLQVDSSSITKSSTITAAAPSSLSTISEIEKSLPPRTPKNNMVTLEFLGRGLGYALQYERMIDDRLGYGAGISYNNFDYQDNEGNSIGRSQIVGLPLFLNYYFLTSAHKVYATGGFTPFYVRSDFKDFISEGNDLTLAGSTTVPTIGLGYEYQTYGGWILRASGYGLYIDRLHPVIGLGTGLAF